MALNKDGYTIIELPAVDDSFLVSFGDLVLDPYCGGEYRYRRFSQYHIAFDIDKDQWQFELLPHRPYITLSKYNSFAGGFYRYYEPLKIDPSVQIDAGTKAIPLQTSAEWQINVHQYRVVATPEIRGISVPEGPHRDGHENVMIAVYQRHQIKGAELQLLPLGGGEPFFTTTVLEGQAVLLDDERMFHYVTDIEPIETEGHRDLIVVAFSRWEDRWYGQEFEQKALANNAKSR